MKPRRKIREEGIPMIKELSKKMTIAAVAKLFDVSTSPIFRVLHDSPKKNNSGRYALVRPTEKPLAVKTKRVYELKRGDVFIYAGVQWVVYSVSSCRILYMAHLPNPQGSGRYSFGEKNQMRVEFLGNFAKTKQNG